jgi:hypothetical protein
MLATLRKKFGNMKAIGPHKENPLDQIQDKNKQQLSNLDNRKPSEGRRSHQS